MSDSSTYLKNFWSVIHKVIFILKPILRNDITTELTAIPRFYVIHMF